MGMGLREAVEDFVRDVRKHQATTFTVGAKFKAMEKALKDPDTAEPHSNPRSAVIMAQELKNLRELYGEEKRRSKERQQDLENARHRCEALANDRDAHRESDRRNRQIHHMAMEGAKRQAAKLESELGAAKDRIEEFEKSKDKYALELEAKLMDQEVEKASDAWSSMFRPDPMTKAQKLSSWCVVCGLAALALPFATNYFYHLADTPTVYRLTSNEYVDRKALDWIRVPTMLAGWASTLLAIAGSATLGVRAAIASQRRDDGLE